MAQQIDKCTTKYFPPNHAQLSKAVMGYDSKHRIRIRSSWTIKARYGALVFALLLVAFGLLFLFAGGVK